MSENQTKTVKSGFSLGTGVFLIFLALKLAEIGQVATWSWWWITSPLWIPTTIVIGIVIIIALITMIIGFIATFIK